jgi:hypothetical protein
MAKISAERSLAEAIKAGMLTERLVQGKMGAPRRELVSLAATNTT